MNVESHGKSYYVQPDSGSESGSDLGSEAGSDFGSEVGSLVGCLLCSGAGKTGILECFINSNFI